VKNPLLILLSKIYSTLAWANPLLQKHSDYWSWLIGGSWWATAEYIYYALTIKCTALPFSSTNQLWHHHGLVSRLRVFLFGFLHRPHHRLKSCANNNHKFMNYDWPSQQNYHKPVRRIGLKLLTARSRVLPAHLIAHFLVSWVVILRSTDYKEAVKCVKE